MIFSKLSCAKKTRKKNNVTKSEGKFAMFTLSRVARVHVCLNLKARYRWMWLNADGSVLAAMYALVNVATYHVDLKRYEMFNG